MISIAVLLQMCILLSIAKKDFRNLSHQSTLVLLRFQIRLLNLLIQMMVGA